MIEIIVSTYINERYDKLVSLLIASILHLDSTVGTGQFEY